MTTTDDQAIQVAWITNYHTEHRPLARQRTIRPSKGFRSKMSDGYDKALEALRRGETIRIQHWKRKEANQHGTPVEVVDTVALFQPVMIITGGEEIPLASRGLEQDEADKLASMPNVQDERNQIHDKE